jgi:dTDP-4-amino-4,6-dideoxygalactose transaminase
MKPYRELFPHARLVLPNTETVAARVIVLPTGETLPPDCIGTIAGVFRAVLGDDG